MVALGAAAQQAPPAVDFKLPALDGGQVRLADHRGKIVLLFFISDDCGTCHEELPFVDRLAKRFGDAGFQVIGLLPREPAPASSLRAASFPLAVLDDATKAAYRVPGYPLHYLVGRDLTLQAKHRGWSGGRERILEAEVRQLLGGEQLNELGLDLYKVQGSWDGHWEPGKGRRLRTDEILPWLSHQDPAQRAWAIEELGRRGARDAVAMLGAVVVAPAEPVAMRRKALAALLHIGAGESAGSYLKVARGAGEPPLLRAEAVLALGQVLDAPGVRDAVAGLLSDPEPNVRKGAATIAGQHCVAGARDALERALAKEANAWVADALRRALESLAACGSAPDGGAPDTSPAE